MTTVAEARCSARKEPASSTPSNDRPSSENQNLACHCKRNLLEVNVTNARFHYRALRRAGWSRGFARDAVVGWTQTRGGNQ